MDSGESGSEWKCHNLLESKILTFSWNNSGNIRTKRKTKFCIRSFVLIFVMGTPGKNTKSFCIHTGMISFPFLSLLIRLVKGTSIL